MNWRDYELLILKDQGFHTAKVEKQYRKVQKCNNVLMPWWVGGDVSATHDFFKGKEIPLEKKTVEKKRSISKPTKINGLTSDNSDRVDSKMIWRPSVAITEAKTSIPWRKVIMKLWTYWKVSKMVQFLSALVQDVPEQLRNKTGSVERKYFL